jgi:hypothetical protein
VVSTEYLDDEVKIVALLPKKVAERYAEFLVDEQPQKEKTSSPPPRSEDKLSNLP